MILEHEDQTTLCKRPMTGSFLPVIEGLLNLMLRAQGRRPLSSFRFGQLLSAFHTLTALAPLPATMCVPLGLPAAALVGVWAAVERCPLLTARLSALDAQFRTGT
jgi:hypothetical protein